MFLVITACYSMILDDICAYALMGMFSYYIVGMRYHILIGLASYALMPIRSSVLMDMSIDGLMPSPSRAHVSFPHEAWRGRSVRDGGIHSRFLLGRLPAPPARGRALARPRLSQGRGGAAPEPRVARFRPCGSRSLPRSRKRKNIATPAYGRLLTAADIAPNSCRTSTTA
jgi:hypothetical protein